MKAYAELDWDLQSALDFGVPKINFSRDFAKPISPIGKDKVQSMI